MKKRSSLRASSSSDDNGHQEPEAPAGLGLGLGGGRGGTGTGRLVLSEGAVLGGEERRQEGNSPIVQSRLGLGG